MNDDIRPGDRVEYVGQSVFDLMIVTHDIGTATRVENGWVHAVWPRTEHELSVPVSAVRRCSEG